MVIIMEENKETKVNPTIETGNIVINEAAIPPAPAPGEQIQSPSQVPVTEQKPEKKKGPVSFILLAVLLIVLGYLIYDRFIKKDETTTETNTVEKTNNSIFNRVKKNDKEETNTTENTTKEENSTNETENDIVGTPVVTTNGNFRVEASKKKNGCSTFKINGKSYKESCKLGSNDVEIQEIINDNYAIIHYSEGKDTYDIVDMDGNKIFDAGNHTIGYIEHTDTKLTFIVYYIQFDANNIEDLAGCNPSTANNYNLNDIVQKAYEAKIVNGVIQTPVETSSQTVAELREDYGCV